MSPCLSPQVLLCSLADHEHAASGRAKVQSLHDDGHRDDDAIHELGELDVVPDDMVDQKIKRLLQILLIITILSS